MKRITVMTPCFNEQENVRELHRRLQAVFATLPQYEFRHLFIDNASTDGTVAVLRELAAEDPAVQVIVNRRNFGHVRSPYHGLLEAQGDAVIAMASDLQDPPELVPRFLELWEAGNPVVMGVKRSSGESAPMFATRRLYYRLLESVSEAPIIAQATGFGLYDRAFVERVREMHDPYPYLRGLVSELGFGAATIEYDQPLRRRGLTKNNVLTLYDLAVLGLTSHSRAALRVMTIAGFVLSFASLLAGLGYLVYKLLFWSRFSAGIAPVVIGVFFLFSIQLFFLGVLGEYVSAIHTRVMRRPPVVERERINLG